MNEHAYQTRIAMPGYWTETKDGDPDVRAIFHRHYSHRKYADGRDPKLFVGPGEKMVLITPDCDAIFIWRKFISMNNQKGINCAVFRNEGRVMSSLLILDAEFQAFRRWGHTRVYTYVNPGRVASANPGYCFKQAGWKVCGQTKRGLIVLGKKI